jgi:hypothetical protein
MFTIHSRRNCSLKSKAEDWNTVVVVVVVALVVVVVAAVVVKSKEVSFDISDERKLQCYFAGKYYSKQFMFSRKRLVL